jgi:hypothetical protein
MTRPINWKALAETVTTPEDLLSLACKVRDVEHDYNSAPEATAALMLAALNTTRDTLELSAFQESCIIRRLAGWVLGCEITIHEDRKVPR